MARAIPVFPLVASINFEFISKSPLSKPPFIILSAARSFTLPPGLLPSNLKKSLTLGLVLITFDITRGVFPIISKMLLDRREGFYFKYRGRIDREIGVHRCCYPWISSYMEF